MAMNPSYLRIADLSFLDRCHPRTAGFFSYWQSKRRGEALPGRADLDPLEMKTWLPGLVLVNVAPDPGCQPPYRLTYRLIGTRVRDLREYEATGMSVQEAYFGNSLDEVLENYRLVIEERKPVYDGDRTISKSGGRLETETLLLPLATDGVTVDMVVCYQEIETAQHG